MAPATEGETHRGGRINRVEVENFKSYGGKRVIGPFVDFTAVVGPNGAGVLRAFAWFLIDSNQ